MGGRDNSLGGRALPSTSSWQFMWRPYLGTVRRRAAKSRLLHVPPQLSAAAAQTKKRPRRLSKLALTLLSWAWPVLGLAGAHWARKE